MNWYHFAFAQPFWLALLLLIPFVWLIGRKNLTNLGQSRYVIAATLRSLLIALVAFALAEVQWVKISERVTTIFLLDQSESITSKEQEAEFRYAQGAVEHHSQQGRGDAAGLIVFGRDANVEQTPINGYQLPGALGTDVDGERSNLSAALRLARASFPEGSARRVVLLSDGNENLGDAITEARALVADGIGIDVAPLPYQSAADVTVTKIVAPADVREGVPFDVNIVLENRTSQTGAAAAGVPGRLLVTRRANGQEQLVAEQNLVVPPGKSVLRFRQQLDEVSFYGYEARFIPDNARADRFLQNNRATAFAQVRGKGRILFIVNSESSQEYDLLLSALRRQQLDVTVQTTNNLFTSLAELQQYDCVVLANVPRTSGDAEGLEQFSVDQEQMLVRNVEQFGAGLIMLGGPDSFGAGGWSNSVLEKALPVDFQVKNSKVAAIGALMLVIDKSGSMDGDKLTMCKNAAAAAVDMLGPLDYIGVYAFDSEAEEVVRLQQVGDKPARVQRQIFRLGPGGGTDMEPGVRRGYAALKACPAAVKHMLVLTDGQTAGNDYGRLAARMRQDNITVSTIAIGSDAATGILQEMASRGGGKYYRVVNPKVLPRIFTRETRRVVRPLVFEVPGGMSPQVTSSHEILEGVSHELPPITGFVLTTVKENPLVETPLLVPRPEAPNNTLLATWTYGLGRTVAFTTDGGQRWTKDWAGWQDYEKLFTQMIRWSMRPLGDQGNFTVSTQWDAGELSVVVQALTKDGEFWNGLPLSGSLLANDGGSAEALDFQQVGPGRYVANRSVDQQGTYLVAVNPGTRQGVLRSGLTIPYSPEFQVNDNNEQLLLNMAALVPEGGKVGEVIRLPYDSSQWEQWRGPDVFRNDLPKGRSLSMAWPVVMLIASVLFLTDVAHRRVHFSTTWIALAMQRLFAPRRTVEAPADERLARLKAKKQSVATRMQPGDFAGSPPDSGVANARYSADGSTAEVQEVLQPTSASAHSPAPPRPNVTTSNEEAGGETYGERLLRAKRQAREDAERRGKS